MNRALSAAVAAVACLLPVESSGAESTVYKQQFLEHIEKAKAFLANAESRKATTPRQRIDSAKEAFALLKLVHQLQENAMEATVPIDEASPTKKDLMLISSGCNALQFMIEATSNYVETDDRAFLGLAREGASLVAAVRKLL